jgi:hypothetical protein
VHVVEDVNVSRGANGRDRMFANLSTGDHTLP